MIFHRVQEKFPRPLTNKTRKFIIADKIEARGSSVSPCSEAAFAGNEREHRRSEEQQLRSSSLGRRRISAGLSRKWSAIECKDPAGAPAVCLFFVP